MIFCVFLTSNVFKKYTLKVCSCFYKLTSWYPFFESEKFTKIYFKGRNFRGRNFRDFREFWADSRKFIPTKYKKYGHSRKFILAKNLNSLIAKVYSREKSEFSIRDTLFLFYKNLVYKNVKAEIWVKIKNNIRTLPRLNSQNHKKNVLIRSLKKINI